MTKWQLWITANGGDDVPQELKVWDTDEEPQLELRLAAYAKDAVINFEPILGVPGSVGKEAAE